ncbi:MAG TPA: hypothetical protein DEA08_03085 [Planctomycetes bacterium]|nr:hypothetical protein [Planctomycetota bacterium]
MSSPARLDPRARALLAVAGLALGVYVLARGSDWLELPGHRNPWPLSALLLLGVGGAALDLSRRESWLARAWQRLRQGPSEAAFWRAFALLLTAGFLYRVWLSDLLGIPSGSWDSGSYLVPALEHPWLPFSEVRTLGAPLLVSLGLALDGLRGVLLVHNLLWLVSSALLCASVARRLRLRGLSLVLLLYLCCSFRNLHFEYALLSEHAARCSYALFAGVALLSWGRPRWGSTLALALAAFAAVLVKPTALALVPAAALLYAAPCLLDGAHSKRQALLHTLALAGLVAALFAGYALVFQQRFGKLATNSFTGTALFAYTGHLTDLEASERPRLRADLRELLPRYRRDYVAKGDERPNWLAFGFAEEDLRADFGERSPFRCVNEELARQPDPTSTQQQQRDRIFLSLAKSGIEAHPDAYLRLVLRHLVRLYRTGPGAFYGDVFASPGAAAYGSERGRAFFTSTHERMTAPYLAARGAPPASLGPSLQAEEPPQPWAGLVFLGTWGAFVVSALAQALLSYGWLLLLLLAPLLGRARAREREHLLLAACLLLTVLGYGVVLALICISETPRFITNVQDLLLLAYLLLGRAELEALTYSPS